MSNESLSSLAVTFQALFNLQDFVIPLILGRLRRYLHLIEGIFSRVTKLVCISEIGRSVGGILAAGWVLSVVPESDKLALQVGVGVGLTSSPRTNSTAYKPRQRGGCGQKTGRSVR
jgi:hypothetical protein